MAYVHTLSGLGVDPATAALVARTAPAIVSTVKSMMGPFGFPKIHEFLDRVARERGPEVVEAVYRAVPALRKSREAPIVTAAPTVSPERMPIVGPERMPIVAAGFAPDLGGAIMPLLIAAGLGLMFILKGR